MVVERIDLLYATLLVGMINLIQTITPFFVYKYWAADWVVNGVDLSIT